MDDDVYCYLYEQHRSNKKSCRTNGVSMNQQSHDRSWQEFGIGYDKELKIAEVVFDLINFGIDVIVDLEVDVTLTINLELKLILSEGVNESTHLLAIEEETPTEEVDEFISFSFDDDDKT
ncbi:hypothetical protein PVK06_002791 [Gossypium arboreum]|uniref:Uncharacterized protein n=1 Tax=Gossypium arboreum TaxID=29729 RepID=A0ABR0R5M6_GOSAR|nr:hypothetical protein PVK06_002791 [Gossypium arboreum]